MNIPKRIRSLPDVVITTLNERAAVLKQHGASIINLGQTIPSFARSEAFPAASAKAMEEETTHIYGSGKGLLGLRETLSVMHAREGISLDPDTEIMITAGGNQAFLLTLLTILEPGDGVLLPTPFFFSHAMAIQAIGCQPIEVPLTQDDGFQLTWEAIEPYMGLNPRAIVIISPNNPTGAVYDHTELVRIGEAAAERNMVVITDETYRQFVYDQRPYGSLLGAKELRPHVITIGSFSKSLHMSGWRVGYLIGPPAFIAHALKVHDSMMICPPMMGQKLALAGLRASPAAPLVQHTQLDERRTFFHEALRHIPHLDWTMTDGGFFAFVRYSLPRSSNDLARDLLEHAHVVVLPGSLFGACGEGYLRISYGSVSQHHLAEACQRLQEYFRNIEISTYTMGGSR